MSFGTQHCVVGLFPDVSSVTQPYTVYTNLRHEDRGTVVVQ